MALTDYDRKHLSNSEQQKIQIATTQYNLAKKKGDTAAMERAASDAAAVRKNASGGGYTTYSDGTYKGTVTGGGSGGSYIGVGSSGGGSSKTEYTPYYNPDVDLGTLGQQQMEQNAPWQVVQNTLNNRYNKAISTPGLGQYANDEIQQAMLDYINGKRNSSENWNDEYTAENPIPQYESEYSAMLDEYINKIINGEGFSYDVESDPVYQQYAEMYRREGDRAMKETLAEAAAGAGGMNSYAITAAQQAQNYYNGQLSDTVPELYQLAYQMYLADIDRQVQNLGILQNADETQYNRYRNLLSDYMNDKSISYEMYKNDYNNEMYNREWDYKLEQDEWEKDKYNKNTAYERIISLLTTGIEVDSASLAEAGITQEQANQILAIARSQLAADGLYAPT